MKKTTISIKINKWPQAMDLIKSSIIFFSIFLFEGIIVGFNIQVSPDFAGVLLASMLVVPGTFLLIFIPRKVTLEADKKSGVIRLGRKSVELNPRNFKLRLKSHTDTPWGTMDWSIRFSNNGKKYILMKSVPQGKDYKLSKEYIEYAAFHQQLLDLENSFKERVNSNEN